MSGGYQTPIGAHLGPLSMLRGMLGNIRYNDHLSIVHINAQSFLCHILEIEIMLNEQNIDILCVSETWMYPSIKDDFIHVPGYNIYRQDYGRGGGVCLLVKNHLKSLN